MEISNSLIHESSPYLLQHAHNPVNWFPWGDEAWNKAKKENKLVLISIGYSSCHWCHVMERESFEDAITAQLMNDHYVCIKVDREERPDIDQVYMTAVQLMSGSGGWPLNCFALPDGRPIYGGTYFPNHAWKDILIKLYTFYVNEPDKARQYAEELTRGIQQTEVIHTSDEVVQFSKDILDKTLTAWKRHFDQKEGGPNRAPKFPLPNNYEFLLDYANATKDTQLLEHVYLTLNKMAFGGIYDQIGGGFARYSVDSIWKVPHFEKMLYDNSQLISLYSKAYRASGNELYKDVVEQTLRWVEREMTSDEGGFYSALDADSEGEEGKFYTWKTEELQTILGDDFPFFRAYYNVDAKGLWEHGNNILLRHRDDKDIADEFSLSVTDLKNKIRDAQNKLLSVRSNRIRPGLDDKQLTSWNALMIKACCDAYVTFGNTTYLQTATRNANLILKKLKRTDGGLFHSYKNGKAGINGYLEDYSFTIEALLSLYEATFEESWLMEAANFADYTLEHFYDADSGFFWFTSDLDPALIARKKEINDNVIPASNSSMAKGLYALGIYFENNRYSEIASRMVNSVSKEMEKYGSGYSNWAILLMKYVYPSKEVVIVGEEAEIYRKQIQALYSINVLYAGCRNDSGKLSLLNNRYIQGETLIYVCQNHTCKLPVKTVPEAVEQISQTVN